MNNYEEVFQHMYQSFNARDIDAVLQLMHVDVTWPNGWEGGYVTGLAAVRDYWQRQWREINPVVTPVSFRERPDGTLEIHVHQLIKDLQGQVLTDGPVLHVYTLEAGKIKRMDIEKP